MTATTTEAIEHLDWEPAQPCEITDCTSGHPPAAWVRVERVSAICVHGVLMCSTCYQRDAEAVDRFGHVKVAYSCAEHHAGTIVLECSWCVTSYHPLGDA